MSEPVFEWDKAAENYARHGVSFEAARFAFDDPFAIIQIDDRHDYGEERFILVGMAKGVLLVIAHTEREDHLRLISARRATKQEHDIYVRQIT